VTEEITESTTSLMLEGMRQVGRDSISSNPSCRGLGRAGSRRNRCPATCRDSPREPIIPTHPAQRIAGTVIDSFPGTDFEAYTCLLGLMKRGFVTF